MLVPGVEGGVTRYLPTGEQMSIFDAAERYQRRRDAADRARREGVRFGFVARLGGEGTDLLGVRAVIAESFERIHRSNLIGMGILPLEYVEGERPRRPRAHRRRSLRHHRHRGRHHAAHARDGARRPTRRPASRSSSRSRVRIDTPDEAEYYRHGGILQYVLRSLAN